ncbi:MAG TPA: ABC transporter substrate-binding protein [Methylomirabilota bacterium]|jgi:NitT/TauT family transport system substrate-binding protein|nr:ABC transporter substrate-binding protein [Methylomirabilota bacterium]
MATFMKAIRGGMLVLAIWAATAVPAGAEEIEISNYGVGTNGMPYGVALAKGYFKEFGIDITGIRSSPGGAPTIRNLLAGNLSFGEAGLTAIVAAIRGGADIRIIAETCNTTAEIGWVVKHDSPVKSIKDLKGRRIGFTNPNSTTHSLALMLLEAGGFQPSDAKTMPTGGFGPGLAALEHGELDVAPFAEPLFSQAKGKYRLLTWSTDVLPPMVDVLAITTERAIKARPDFLRGMLKAWRKAVDFMNANPHEAAQLIAKDYKVDVEVAEAVIRKLLKKETSANLPYWGTGQIHVETLNNLMQAQRLLGHKVDSMDWSKVIDESFLPEDARTKKP